MPKIRWREKDARLLITRVRAYNAKITRLTNANPQLADFYPKHLDINTLRSNITTRAEFNRTINSINRFFTPTAAQPIITDSNIKTTRYERREVGIKVGIVNRARAIEAKRANVSTEKGTMGSIEANNLKPKKYNPDKIRPSDWDKYISTVERQAMSNYQTKKMRDYKRNYIEAIRRNLGDGEYAERLIELVEKLDAEFMYRAYYDDPVLQIQFTSDPLPAETIAEASYDRWELLISESEGEKFFE